MVMGRPAKVVRALTEDDFARIRESSALYVEYAQTFRGPGVRPIG